MFLTLLSNQAYIGRNNTFLFCPKLGFEGGNQQQQHFENCQMVILLSGKVIVCLLSGICFPIHVKWCCPPAILPKVLVKIKSPMIN